ncbi:hypothetical protein KVR01_006387 [Diaporthe batatas]|uniref:uncharacterized protein n=1 Tax=Diaporthe batatas TaxID=748121 RepID=UPI001D044A8F|nr:uncharacterized protein KVR01_006387 [Diaporthe batatas]KAG8164469.1 hypothetical protein KVR01_006387 [Diaporthe batatas]
MSLETCINMDEPEGARMTSCEEDSEETNAGTEKSPAMVVFKSKNLLWAAFVLILCHRILLLLIDAVVLGLMPGLILSDSSGSGRSVLSVLPVVIGISSGVLRLPMAKIIDSSPRASGFNLPWIAAQLGVLILQQASTLAGATTGSILYGIGSSGMDFILTVILADMTSIKNRGLIYGIYTIPLILRTLAAPHIAQLELLESRIHREEALGICAITMCAVCFTLTLLFPRARSIASYKEEQGDTNSTTGTEEKPRVLDALRRFVVALDIPGVILAITGISLLLLAPNHVPGTQEGWSAGIFSALLVLGFFSISLLYLWEYYLGPATYFPKSLIKDSNFVGGCGVATLTAASIACWSSHVSSYLQVVGNQTMADADWVSTTQILAFAFSAPLFGLYVQQTGKYRSLAVCSGACLLTMTIAHIFHFHGGWAWTVSQILVGSAESALLLLSQLAIMAFVDHENVAMALGIWGTFVSIAVGIGSTAATTVWTYGLWTLLPADSEDLIPEPLAFLEKQKQYPLGSTTRNVLVAAYEEYLQNLLIAALFIAGFAFLCVLSWKNINLLRDTRDAKRARRAGGVIW